MFIGCFAALYVLLQPLPSDVFLENATSPEIKAAIEAGANRIIIPTGGTEQNGRQLPLGKHNQVVRYTAQQLAQRLGHSFVAPVIAYVPEGTIDPPDGHMRYAGTLSVRESTFEALLEDTVRSLAQSGFTHIYLLGDSGGNQRVQAQLAERLDGFKQGVRVAHLSDYYAANAQEAWMHKRYPDIKDPTGHAGYVNVAEVMGASDSETINDAIYEQYRERFSGLSREGMAHQIKRDGEALLELKINAALHQIQP